MIFVLLDPHGNVIASGSWRSVVEAGEEDGVIGRRYSRCDGSEASPILRLGYSFVPAAMIPENAEQEFAL